VREKFFKICFDPEPFTIICSDARTAALEWIATKEVNGPVRVPTLLISVKDLTVPDGSKDVWVAVTTVLRWRDEERRRCGLPPYWAELREDLEARRDYFLRRALRAFFAEMGGERGG